MGTAVFSAVSLKLCCWGPLVLTGVAGISGSSVYFSWLAYLKPYLLALAFLSLMLAFYKVYKKSKVDGCGQCETKKTSFFRSRPYIWLVAVFVVAMTLVSYHPQILRTNPEKEIIAFGKSDIRSIELNIDGMVCTGCEVNIDRSVKKINGVVKVKTSFGKGTSLIRFDSTKTNSKEITEVIRSKGYIIQNNWDE